MPAKKGTRPPNAGIPRKKGSVNRVTREMRSIIKEFVENNVEGAQALYDKVAKTNPAKALDILVKMAEFVVPKLNRTEVSMPSLTISGPITNAQEASRTYAQVMGDTTIDLTTITYAPIDDLPANMGDK
jgi:hypothetical protein